MPSHRPKAVPVSGPGARQAARLLALLLPTVQPQGASSLPGDLVFFLCNKRCNSIIRYRIGLSCGLNRTMCLVECLAPDRCLSTGISYVPGVQRGAVIWGKGEFSELCVPEVST